MFYDDPQCRRHVRPRRLAAAPQIRKPDTDPITMTPPPVFRFAPSPNGLLHEGHALSALLNHDAARAAGGRMLLRIEDIDAARARPEFEAAIFEDLAWLGIDWPQPVMRQSERFAIYRRSVDRLLARGLLYPATMSRSVIRRRIAEIERAGRPWPRDPDGAPHYPGTERQWSGARRRAAMTGGDPYALRLDMARALAEVGRLTWTERNPFDPGDARTIAANPAAWGDVVLARRDAPASYHLCVCIDDAGQAVTHVVRGLDLEPATGIHRLVQALLGLPAPVYWHHRLIRDETGAKLSKSAGGHAIRALRDAGLSTDDVRRRVDLSRSKRAGRICGPR